MTESDQQEGTQGAISEARRWRLLPHFLLRRAGFPFQLVAQLAAPRSAVIAADAARAARQKQQLREALTGQLIPAEVLKARARDDRATLRTLSDWRKRVGRGRAVPLPEGTWSAGLQEAASKFVAAAAQEAQLRETLSATLSEETWISRRRLKEVFASAPAWEALFLLSPDIVENMGEHLYRAPSADPTHDERALERRLYAFVQRLGAKNETTSFFGPMAYGWIEAGDVAYRFGPESPTGVLRRETFFAFWAAAALGKAASQDPALRPHLPVRRVAVAAVDGAEGRRPDGSRVPLDAAAQALYAQVDDLRTVGGLGAAVGCSEVEAERTVRLLEKHGFVRRDLEPLSTVAYPLDDVSAQLPSVPEAARWRTSFDGLRDCLRRFETADVEARRKILHEAEAAFTAASGVPARRAPGRTYADRTILYEDCLGDMQPVRMSPAEAERLERALAPALEVGARYGLLRHQALRTLASRTLQAMGGRAWLLDFADTLDQRVGAGELDVLLEPARHLRQVLAERCRAASDGRVARLRPEQVADLFPPPGQGGRFASPDVMLEVGGRDAGRVVIGEVHPYMFAWGSQGHFAPDAGRLQAACAEDLRPWGGKERLATVLRRRRHKGLVSLSFPGTFIEVTGRASVDPARRLPIAALEVVEGADGPELRGPRGALTLYVGEDDHPHLRAFAPPQVEIPPVRLGERTPRIELGELVLQRERWDLPRDALPGVEKAADATALAVEVAAAQAELGWPRHLFALSPEEPKPMCLDLEVPFARAMLQRLLTLGPLALSEMVPAPDRLWLRRSGGAHTSELRMAMVRDP